MKLPADEILQRRGGVTAPADLTAAGKSVARLPAPSSVTQQEVLSTFDDSRLCEAVTFPVDFAVAGESIVLRRQNAPRLGLLVVNVNIAGGIYYAFDIDANSANSIPITNGGNRLFDVAVPQGDLHIFASGAGRVVIEYLLPSLYSKSKL